MDNLNFHIFSRFYSKNYCLKNNDGNEVGAAAIKIDLLSEALKNYGHSFNYFASPKSINRLKKLEVIHSKNGIEYYYPVVVINLLSLIFTVKHSLFYLFKYTRKGDFIIFYNMDVTFLLTAIFAKWFSRIVILEIEDKPNLSLNNNLIILYLHKYFIRSKFIVTSVNLAVALSLRNYFVFYSIFNPIYKAREIKEFNELRPLNIHFGGTLNPDTGLNTFRDLLLSISELRVDQKERIRILSTGQLSSSDVEQFNLIALAGNFSYCHLGYLSLTELDELYRSQVDISLSLKLIGGLYDGSTFPSKVFHLSCYGIAVLSTRISEVEKVFNEDSCFFINENSGYLIREIILSILSDSSLLYSKIKYCENDLTERFSSKMIIPDFISFVKSKVN
jgi:hypothetical protein